MKRAANALFAAFTYFTILPAGKRAPGTAPDALALSFLPFPGAIVGAIAGGAGAMVLRYAGAPWAALIALTVAIALTGAIHVDGFLDSCDALFASVAPSRRLEILKDPRHGTFAVVGMYFAGAFWLFALSGVASPSFPLTLAFSSAAARLAVIPNAWIFPYARAGAVTPAFSSRPSVVVFALGFIAVEALAYAMGMPALLIAPIAIAVVIVLSFFAARRLGGGLTGDVYGFLIVCAEIAILIALAAMHAHIGA